ncbi:N-6 DNA methylase [Rhizobium daejeonense]
MTFENFVESAIETARIIETGEPAVTLAHPLLNGVPYSVFRREVSIETRREIGAFFSSDAMAMELVSQLEGRIDDDALVLDPTCGIGNLLLARAATLPLRDTLASTLTSWGDRLAGFDSRDDLVQLCKVRLCMLARARGNFNDEIDPLRTFPQILGQDMFAPESEELLSRADAVLFNPPFGKTRWPEKLGWASGEINAAAIFLDRLTSVIKPMAPIAAVLPEVLRCGARYARFRSMLSQRNYSGTFTLRGRFDPWTDVDVFTTLLTRSTADEPLWRSATTDQSTQLADHFEIRVGTVVPHRDPESGASRLYICAKTTPPWETAFEPRGRRLYQGRVFSPPFVVIRRTSSPSDKMRAVATVVTGKEPVAVENHLLVAIPNDSSLSACQSLIEMLRLPEINDRLNDLMRCRHLTTGAIKSLPWIAPRV